MATPWKHPKTGMYWLRVRVPVEMRALLGKEQVQRTLGTKDIKDAKRLFVKAMADLQREWSALKAAQGAPRLTTFQVRGLAGEFYRWYVDRHMETASAADGWGRQVEHHHRTIRPSGGRPSGAVGLYLPEVERFLADRGIVVNEMDYYDLALAAAAVGSQAKETLARNAEGDYSEDPREAKFPKWERVEKKLQITGRRLTLDDHFEDFAKENGLEPKSRKKYRSCIADLCRSIGSDNLNDATGDKLIAWKKELVARGLKPRGIRDGYFAAARSFFNWAVENKKAPSNPMDGIGIKVPKEHRTRKPHFTDEEAALILSEALRPADGRVSEEFAAARRWVPWILAYTGARVNEITALRVEDVSCRSLAGRPVWVIHLHHTKVKEPRWVPLHPHLVEQGFPAFVESRGSGPLFYDPERRRDGTDENPQNHKVGEKLAEWVRLVGIDDTEVDPNHGWRHRFNFVARRVRMIPEIRDAIKGHKARTEGEEYGGAIDWDMMWPEINLLPRYAVDPATGPAKSTPARQKATRDRAATKARAKARGRLTNASRASMEGSAAD